jgi:hypothetical protein
MITLEKTKLFFMGLRRSSPYNLMVPVVISLISAIIFLKNRTRF